MLLRWIEGYLQDADNISNACGKIQHLLQWKLSTVPAAKSFLRGNWIFSSNSVIITRDDIGFVKLKAFCFSRVCYEQP